MKDWGTLQAAVLRTLDALEDSERKAMMPIWQALALSDIHNSLRAGWMIRRGQAVAYGQKMTLPPSMLELGGLVWVNRTLSDEQVAELERTGAVAELETVPGYPLEALGPEQVAEVERRCFNPFGYVVEGHNIRLIPAPTARVLTRFTYYSAGSELVEDEDTNEILHHLPAAFFYGMLRHAAIFSGDAEGEQRWTSALATTIDRCNLQAYGWQGTGISIRPAA